MEADMRDVVTLADYPALLPGDDNARGGVVAGRSAGWTRG
jgi:hypothetical protein